MTHIPKNNDEYARFKKLISQAPLPPDHLTLTDKTLLLLNSLAINPKAVLENWLNNSLTEGQDWTAHNQVILAAGYGLKNILKHHNIPLRFSRGQLSWARSDTQITAPMTYGGYVIPFGDEILVGATHDRLTDKDPFDLRHEDDLKNFEGAKTYCCLLYTSPSPRDGLLSRMPSSA